MTEDAQKFEIRTKKDRHALRRIAQVFSYSFGLTALAIASTPTAHAFELFGYRLFGSDEPAQEQTAVPNPLPYTVTMTLTGGDDDLKSTLEATSLLMSEKNSPPSGEAGLISRAVNDFERLVGRLYMSARYGGTVDISISGVPLQEALQTSDLPDNRPPLVDIKVDAGPLFVFGQVKITVDGVSDEGNIVSTSPEDYGLIPGETAPSVKVVAAETSIRRSFADKGFPKAKITKREIVADHANNELDVNLTVHTGRRASFGPVAVKGAKRTDPAFIISQAAVPVGSTYNPKEIKQAEERLLDLGIFSSVRLVPADAINEDGSLPITIDVSERKRNTLGAGATFSSTEGFGFEGYWERRNLLGKGESLRFDASVGRIGSSSFDDMEYSAKVTFAKPGVFGPKTNFTTSLGAKQENPDPYRSRNATADANLVHKFSEAMTGSLGAEVYFADEEDVYGANSYLLTGIPAQLTYDTRDNILNPTKGVNALLFAEPAYDFKHGNSMFFVKGRASTYYALDEAARFVLAGRVAAGSIFGASNKDIPAARRYFVGGGGSIRGYAYRNVGPKVDGEVAGGRSFFETSVELRAKVTETIGVVGFIDAGNAFASVYPDFAQKLKIGVGAGVRYYTPVGPLRLDVAVPLEPDEGDPSVAVYVGLSQAF